MTVLVINSGSSSIKYQLIDPESGESIAKSGTMLINTKERPLISMSLSPITVLACAK